MGEGEGDEAAGYFRASWGEREDDDAPGRDIGWPGAVEDWEEELFYGFRFGYVLAVLLPGVVD